MFFAIQNVMLTRARVNWKSCSYVESIDFFGQITLGTVITEEIETVFDARTKWKLSTSNPFVPKLYCLPKTHKDTTNLKRIIVSNSNAPLKNISKCPVVIQNLCRKYFWILWQNERRKIHRLRNNGFVRCGESVSKHTYPRDDDHPGKLAPNMNHANRNENYYWS